MKRIGLGNTAEVFDGDNGKAYKLFFPGYPREAVKKEYENAMIMQKSGIPVPKVYGMIFGGSDHVEQECDLSQNQDEIGCNLSQNQEETELDLPQNQEETGLELPRNRDGIIYECLHGATMLEKIFEIEDVEGMIRQFCNLHQEVLAKTSQELHSYKDFYRMLASMGPNESLAEYIDGLPDGDCILHGDYHPGNAWINDDGRFLVIDFMNVCRGPKEVDIARTYFLITAEERDPERRNDEELNRMKKIFGDAYLQMMNTNFADIEKYYIMVKECRKCEYGC